MKRESLNPVERIATAASALALACGAIALSETAESEDSLSLSHRAELEAYMPEEIEIPALPFAGMAPKTK